MHALRVEQEARRRWRSTAGRAADLRTSEGPGGRFGRRWSQDPGFTGGWDLDRGAQEGTDRRSDLCERVALVLCQRALEPTGSGTLKGLRHAQGPAALSRACAPNQGDTGKKIDKREES